MIGSKFSRHGFNQSEVKPKPFVARACAFSRALCRLRVITSSFDWFTGLSPCFLIGQSNYFGFDLTTLDWNSLYSHGSHIDDRFSSWNVWERVSVRKNKSFQSLGTQYGRPVNKTNYSMEQLPFLSKLNIISWLRLSSRFCDNYKGWIPSREEALKRKLRHQTYCRFFWNIGTSFKQPLTCKNLF